MHLPAAQFEVLEVLMLDPGRRWSKDQIIYAIDPVGTRPLEGGAIHVALSKLRRCLRGAVTIDSGDNNARGWTIARPKPRHALKLWIGLLWTTIKRFCKWKVCAP